MLMMPGVILEEANALISILFERASVSGLSAIYMMISGVTCQH
jgi:hypothetical protein